MRIEIIRKLLSIFHTICPSRIKVISESPVRTVENKTSALHTPPRIAVNKNSFGISLSKNINLFGNILGEVIKELEGNDVFNAVEELRAIAKSVRRNPSLDRSNEIVDIVQKLNLEKTTKVLKAFTIYFHLINEAEKLEIIRVNKERELNTSLENPRKESISEAIFCLWKRGVKPEEMQALLNRLNIQPVFTAHPTEVKRPELMTTLNAISNLVQEDGVSNHIAEVKRYIKQLWLIPEVRSVQPTVQQEVDNTLYFLNNNVFPLIPTLHNDLKNALNIYYDGNNFHIPDFIKIGSWVGGDRDGNPNVTPQVTEEVVKMYSSGAELDIREHSDVHARVLSEILSKNPELRLDKPYIDLSEEEKIKTLTKMLLSSNSILLSNIAYSEEAQNVLKVFNVINETHKTISKEAIRCYVISFTGGISDVLEVMLLAKEAGLICKDKSNIDIVPLFETVEDLRNAHNLLEQLFTNPLYEQHLKLRNHFQEIMLGYSDSNKDGGYLSANVELYNAQRKIINVCKERNIQWRFFHGRGGSIGRGGGQAGRAIQSMPEGSVNGKLRVTEQGEVVFSRYSPTALAHRHLEAIIHSVLLASTQEGKPKIKFEQKWLDLASKLSELSCVKYRTLIYDDPEFLNFYLQATPIKFISKLSSLIASRPASRKGLDKIEDLRAIPWVTSWTQTRMMIPSWYGVGTALKEVSKYDDGIECLKQMYNNWSFFKTIIDNCQLSLAKADMLTASQYVSLVEPEELGIRIFKDILEEYNLTSDMLLKVTGQNEILENIPVIKKSIRLRNPYTDPLNYIQVQLLKRYREANKDKTDEAITPLILNSVHGIAAGMQETG